MLEWFSEDERGVCDSCGERTSVTLPEIDAHFCLACGAIAIGGRRFDVGQRLEGLGPT